MAIMLPKYVKGFVNFKLTSRHLHSVEETEMRVLWVAGDYIVLAGQGITRMVLFFKTKISTLRMSAHQANLRMSAHQPKSSKLASRLTDTPPVFACSTYQPSSDLGNATERRLMTAPRPSNGHSFHNDFVPRIKERMRQEGISLKDIAEATKIPFGTLKHWMRGELPLSTSFDALRQLAAYLGLDPEYFVNLVREDHHWNQHAELSRWQMALPYAVTLLMAAPIPI